MRQAFLTLTVLFSVFWTDANSQATLMDLDGRWCFSGSRSTVFTVQNDSLFVSLVSSQDGKVFEDFYLGRPVRDKRVSIPVSAQILHNRIYVNTEIKRQGKPWILSFMFDVRDTTRLHYLGDVYFNDESKQVARIDSFCDPNVPYCTNRLFSRQEMVDMRRGKSLLGISQTEVLEMWQRHRERLKERCNLCVPAFADADLNLVALEMGFDPLVRVPHKEDLIVKTAIGTYITQERFPQDTKVLSVYRAYLKQHFSGTMNKRK